ncbi:MAG: carboxypeptidase-like regulatory domain-containing protein, partial [Schleiferiaceae bacterium]
MVALPALSWAQVLTQTVRGTIVDADSKFPLMGATVSIGDQKVVTDDQGSFKLVNIPVGRQTLTAGLFGYGAQTRALELNSAKEAVLTIGLQEVATQLGTVEVTAVASGQAKNEMATVSARQFSVEETNLYAGSRGEPARMATNFAGVQGSDDQRNDLVIRGNTPAGVLYRMEGINIPNPNHFSIPGTGGGPVTILNNKFLANSDFFTGAWPAEYGNAIAGVFDLQMRDGNNEKFEGSAQLGLLGTELMLEGPLGPAKEGQRAPSFLGVYRYSTLSMFQALNINLGTNAIPKYQDGAFRLTFPQKNGGKLALWTMFGKSDIEILISNQTDTSGFESYGSTDRDQYFGSDMIVGGVNYTRPINKRTFMKAGIAASSARIQAVNT